MLSAGFRSRVVARSTQPVGARGYAWHRAPDGGACFATPEGGWIYTSNSEVSGGRGGCGALRFSPAAEVVDAYPILGGTSLNCAGGATPWGTWLSCEEHDTGVVWECDPRGERAAVSRPRMGRFAHEAVAVDPVGRKLYMTEDVSDGRFYRFTPRVYPDLSDGLLEVLVSPADRGAATWAVVPDPSADTSPTRRQVPESKTFDGGEGIWHDAGTVYFTTKGDNRVWIYDIAGARLDVLYDAAALEDPPLTGVDNLVVSPSGDVIVAEDGGDMDLVLVTPERTVARLVKVTGQDRSEICGPAFDPSGTRLYFSSQRGPSPSGPGVTYEMSGPFRARRPRIATVQGERPDGPTAKSGDRSQVTPASIATVVGMAGLGVIATALGVRRLRTRKSPAEDLETDGGDAPRP